MARAAIVNAELRQDISELTKQWNALNTAYENFARKKIEFAKEIARLWEQAKALDTDAGSEANQNHFREQLREIIQSDNKTPYANSLPPQRDSLYAVSTAIDKKRPIQKWIDSGKLSPESTVREVVALSSTKRVKKQSASSQRNVSVSLEFSCTYQRAAEILANLIGTEDVVFVKSERAFRSALAEAIGREAFSGLSHKVK